MTTFLIRAAIFTCITFTALSAGQWIYVNQPTLLIPYLSIVAGPTVAYIFKIIEG